MKFKLTNIGICMMLILSCTSSKYTLVNNDYFWIVKDLSGEYQTKLEIHDVNTFKILRNSNYAKDKKSVFYRGRKIESADPETFTVINDNGYSKDKKQVFLITDIIMFANPEKFKVLGTLYSKDKNHVYCGNLPLDIKGSEVLEFKVTNQCTGSIESNAKHFIEENPEYNWIDTTLIKGIIRGVNGLGETSKRKFKGFQEIKD